MLFTRHQRNINNVHKDGNDLMSVIILLGTYVNGGQTDFLNIMTMNEIGNRAHFLNHLHGRCVVGALDKNLHKGYIWTGYRAVLFLSYKIQYFFTLYIMIQHFMKNIYSLLTEKYIH